MESVLVLSLSNSIYICIYMANTFLCRADGLIDLKRSSCSDAVLAVECALLYECLKSNLVSFLDYSTSRQCTRPNGGRVYCRPRAV